METSPQGRKYMVLTIKKANTVDEPPYESIGYKKLNEDGTVGYMDLWSLSILSLKHIEKVQRVGAPRSENEELKLIKVSPYEGSSPNGIEEASTQELRGRYIKSLLKHRKISHESVIPKVIRVVTKVEK